MNDLTPVQQLANIESELHDEFQNEIPSEEQIITFIKEKNFPKMDGGISIGIATVALLIEGWRVYREEMDRKSKKEYSSNKVYGVCLITGCGAKSIPGFKAGEYICEVGHKWTMP